VVDEQGSLLVPEAFCDVIALLRDEDNTVEGFIKNMVLWLLGSTTS